MAQSSAKALQSSLSKLQISQSSKGTPTKLKKAEPVESWDDEDEDSSSDTETEQASTPPTTGSLSSPAPPPPPPTPSSPSFFTHTTSPYRTFPPFGLDGTASNDGNQSSGRGDEERKRPEKSTAVASRLIAAGIGQKAPKRTKEQREYDQAMKVQEKKKRDQAREEEERRKREAEQAKRDVWGD